MCTGFTRGLTAGAATFGGIGCGAGIEGGTWSAAATSQPKGTLKATLTGSGVVTFVLCFVLFIDQIGYMCCRPDGSGFPD